MTSGEVENVLAGRDLSALSKLLGNYFNYNYIMYGCLCLNSMQS